MAQETILKIVPPEHGIYHSVMPGFYGTEDSVTEESITSFVKKCGKLVAWVNFSNNWYKGIKFPAKEIKIITDLGSIPFVRLMPRTDYSKGKDKNFPLEKILNGTFDDKLRKWAQDAKAYGKPLILDFAPEMNGKWFQWNGLYYGAGEMNKYGDKSLPDGPEIYRDTYRHIIEIFRDEKAYNITWAFHVNAFPDPEIWWNVYEYYYPGDNYIDWIGVSVYGPQDKHEQWLTFQEILDEIYSRLTSLSPVKPLAIFEMGVIDYPETGSKAEWINNAYNVLLSGRYPRIKSVSWWNENFMNSHGRLSNLRIDSSPDALNAYRQAINFDFFTPYVKTTK